MNWKVATGIVVVILLAGLGAGIAWDWRVDADFPAIKAKSNEADVKHLMGEPKAVQKSCAAYDTSVAPDCDHVFIYKSIFAPVRSKYWLVFFDKNDQVTATSSELEP